MNHATREISDGVPAELMELSRRVRRLSPEARAALEPLVEELLEQVRLRGRVLALARDALEQMRLDLEMTRFDLEATRRERDQLRRLLDRTRQP